MTYRVLILNGGLSGSGGNTAKLLREAEKQFNKNFNVSWCHLSEGGDHQDQVALCKNADGFLVGTGTYWGSCSSVLQDFFERMTETEGSDVWLGKPAALIVSAHSAGAESVLARLQHTLSLFGVILPPMACMTYTAITHEVAEQGSVQTEAWQLSDIEIVCHNLQEAMRGGRNWRTWPTDSRGFRDVWISS